MTIPSFIRLASASGLALTLTACMDVSMTIDVTSQTEAEATVVTAMARDMYDLMVAQTPPDEEAFCSEGTVVESAETVECTLVESGPFEEIDLDAEDGEGPVIKAIGGGQVRVAFPTGALAASFADETEGEQDAQMKAMMTSIFEGHTITMTVTGGTIVDTNMEIAANGTSASYEIPFTELFSAELDLPDEIYAVVQK